jgi:hypothetical protein
MDNGFHKLLEMFTPGLVRWDEWRAAAKVFLDAVKSLDDRQLIALLDVASTELNRRATARGGDAE